MTATAVSFGGERVICDNEFSIIVPHGCSYTTEKGNDSLFIFEPEDSFESGTYYVDEDAKNLKEAEFARVSAENTDKIFEPGAFSRFLERMAEKRLGIKLSISIGDYNSTYGDNAEYINYGIVLDSDDVKSGFYTMDVAGNTHYIDVVATRAAAYTGIVSIIADSNEEKEEWLSGLLRSIEPVNISGVKRSMSDGAQIRVDINNSEKKGRNSQKERSRKKSALDCYASELVKWKIGTEREKVLSKRKEQIDDEVKALYDNLLRNAEKEYEKCSLEANAVKINLSPRIRSLEEDLSHAGIFAFGLKKALKSELLDLNKQIDTVEQKLRESDNNLDAFRKGLMQIPDSERRQIESKVNAANPLPERPVPSEEINSTPRGKLATKLTQAIYQEIEINPPDKKIVPLIAESMSSGVEYTAEDMLNCFDCVWGFSIYKISSLLRKITEAGLLVKKTRSRVSYFRLATEEEILNIYK